MTSTLRAIEAGGAGPSETSLSALSALALALVAWAAPAAGAHPLFAAAAFVAVVACCTLLALGLTARLVTTPELDLRLAAALALFPIVAATAVTVLGLTGALYLPPLLLLLGAAAWLEARTGRAPWLLDSVRCALGSRPPFSTSFALALFLGVWLLEVSHALRYTTQESDSMWYHLPMVAHWIESGALGINESIPLIARAYPGMRQAALAALTLPLGNEHLALLGLLELPAFLCALIVAARRAGASPGVALSIACYGASMPVVLQATRSQGTDLPLGASIVLAYVLLRDALATGAARTALLAGLSLGSAGALKFSGPIYAALVVGACAFEAVLARPRSQWSSMLRARVWICLALAALAVAGPWYGRNLLRFGNPFYPAPFLGFHGPLDLERFSAKQLGMDLTPLLESWRHFPAANGWLVVVMLAAPVALGALVVLKRRPASEHVALLLLTLLCFAAFLMQPFNRPSFQPYYNMRYLIGWSGLLLVASAAVLRAAPVQWLFLAGAVANIAAITRWVGWIAFAGVLGAFVVRHLSGALVRHGELFTRSRSALARAAALALASAGVIAAANLRSRLQYDPGYGYRDSASDRGWGVLGAWVHGHLSGCSLGLHGDDRAFPYYGDRLNNRVALLDVTLGPAEVASAARDQRLDYVVCLTPMSGRDSTGAFQFEDSLGPALLEQFPSQFVVERQARGSYVLRVVR